jgi:hypothetical protein
VGDLLDNVSDRRIPVTLSPNDTGSVIQLVNEASLAIIDDGFTVYETNTEIRLPSW